MINNKLFSIAIVVTFIFIFNACAGSGHRRKKSQLVNEIKREITYGRLLAKEILKKFPMLKNKKLSMYINLVGKSVALFSGRSDIEYHFAVLDTNSINAYATPGGYVFITKGAIKLMKNEAELAGVLAHEIAHVNLKHIMKELPPPRDTKGFVNIVASILVAQGTFVSTAFNSIVSRAAKLLFEKGYKIKSEYEADKTALYYASQTGYYPKGLYDFLDRMHKYKEKNKKTVVYNTHPSTADRLKRISNIISKENFNLNKQRVESRFNQYKYLIAKKNK